jgi:hypothetical protein
MRLCFIIVEYFGTSTTTVPPSSYAFIGWNT